MNKTRRKEILEALELIDQARTTIQTVAEEERDSFDRLPYSLQTSDKGIKMDANADALDDLLDSLDSIDTEAKHIT